MANPYHDAVTADSPTHWWRFDEASGSTLVDSAGTADATVTGATVGVDTGIANLGNAVSYDGTDDHTAHPIPSFGLELDGAHTVEFWVKAPSGAPALSEYVMGTVNDGTQPSTLWGIQHFPSSEVLAIEARLDADSAVRRLETPTLTNIWDGNWHHLVFSVTSFINPASGRITYDGVSSALVTGGSPIASGAALSFQYDVAFGARNVRSVIEAHIGVVQLTHPACYPTALSDTRALAHYDAAFAAGTDPANLAASVTNDDVTLTYDGSF